MKAKELIRINLFLGSNKVITQKELMSELIKGFIQVIFGYYKKVESVDKKVNKLTIEQFLK